MTTGKAVLKDIARDQLASKTRSVKFRLEAMLAHQAQLKKEIKDLRAKKKIVDEALKTAKDSSVEEIYDNLCTPNEYSKSVVMNEDGTVNCDIRKTYWFDEYTAKIPND